MFYLGQKLVGDGAPCFITFELGPTHNGVASAKRLIKHAADAGADAVKVQIMDPDRLVSDRMQPFSYGVLKDRTTGEVETVEEPLYDLLKRRFLTASEWHEVKDYSDSLGMAFFSTVGFDEDVELLEDLKCHSIKIASADIDHFPLIRCAAKTGMCIQLDTGMATLGEVEAAVDVIRQEGNEDIIIHQCPSGYPARLESINLNMIPTLKQMFPYPIAFSDHTPGCEMDIAALALGANLVEKTITEDKMTRSVEHVMSIEPEEMKVFVKTIREVEIAMGKGRRTFKEEEKRQRDLVRRSAYIKKDMPSGRVIGNDDLEYRRPGKGISPSFDDKILGSRLKKSKKKGDLLEWQDLGE